MLYSFNITSLFKDRTSIKRDYAHECEVFGDQPNGQRWIDYISGEVDNIEIPFDIKTGDWIQLKTLLRERSWNKLIDVFGFVEKDIEIVQAASISIYKEGHSFGKWISFFPQTQTIDNEQKPRTRTHVRSAAKRK